MNEGHRYDVMEATSVLRIHIYPDSTEEILTVVSPITVDTESYNNFGNKKKYNHFTSPSNTLSPDGSGNYYTDSGIDSSNFTSPQQIPEGFSPEKRRESSSIYFVPINPLQIPEEEEGEEDIISERTLSFPNLEDNKRIGDSYQLTRSQERTLESASTINSSEIDIPELGEGEEYNIEEESFHEDYQNVLLKEGTQTSQTLEKGEKQIVVVEAEASVSYLLKNTIQEAGIVEATVFPKAYASLQEKIKIYPITRKFQEVGFVPLYSLINYIRTNKSKELTSVPLYNIVDYIKHKKKIELEYSDIKDFVDIKEDNKISVTVEAAKENIGSVVAYRYPTSAQYIKIAYDINRKHNNSGSGVMLSSTGYNNTTNNLGKRTSIPLDEIYPSSKAFPQMNKHVYKQDIIRNNSITSVRSNAPDINGIIDIQMSVGKNYSTPSTGDSFGFYVRGGDKKKNESTLVVSHVKKDSPSDVCGLMVGDNIISINGVMLENLSLIKAERLYEESIKERNITIKIVREKKLKYGIKNEVVLLNKTPEIYDDNYFKRKGDYKISSSPQSDLGEELLEEEHNLHHHDNQQSHHSQSTAPAIDPIYRNSNKNDKRNGDILNIKTQQQHHNFQNSHSPSTSVINSTVLNFSPTSYTTSGVDSTHSFSPRSDSGASSSGGMSDYKVSRVESKKKDKIGKVIDFVPEVDRHHHRHPNTFKYSSNIDEIEQDYHAAGLTPIHDVDSQPKLIRNYNYNLIEKSSQSQDSSRPYGRREVTYLPPNRQISYEDDEIGEAGKDYISSNHHLETTQTLQRCPVVEMHPQYEKNNRTSKNYTNGRKDRTSGIRRSIERAGYNFTGEQSPPNGEEVDEDNESYVTVPSRVQSILKDKYDDDEDIYYDVKYSREDEDNYEGVKTAKNPYLKRQSPLVNDNKVILKPDEYILKDEESAISEGIVRYYDRDMQQIGRAYSYEESTTTSMTEDQDALRKLVRQQRLPAPGDPFSKNRLDADNRYENVSKSLEKQIKKHKQTIETPVKAVSGKKLCGHCDKTLGQGAAMIIESLKLQFHLSCFRCIECGIQLGNGTTGTDVRVRGRKLYCRECYHSAKFETGTENRISTTPSKMLNRIQV
uniref:PDZ domain-containing protein n=1 Tax=Strongyloides papillosus TaxID=174720 RepID=A0A0N5BZ75_STREA